jgi:hypothetical protein
LFEVGLKQIKMRHHSPVARIEAAVADLHRFLEDDPRDKIVERFKRSCRRTKYVPADDGKPRD